MSGVNPTGRKLLFILIACLTALTVSCTSTESGGDQSVLDAELDSLDTDPDAEVSEDAGLEDIEDVAEDSIEDELGEGGDDGDDFEDEDSEIKELADEGDDEIDESGEDDLDDEFAEEGDEEIDEDDEDEVKEVADEEALKKELGQDQDYPVAANAAATFPEEVQNQAPMVDSTQGPAGAPPIISVSKIDEMPTEPPEPKVPQDDLGQPDPIVAKPDDFNEDQNWVPVVKVKTDPFFRNGRLMNTVYISRPGDSVESVASKIFGNSGRAAVLLEDNPHIDRGMDPGDKIYYNSPNNPDGKDTLKVYYEDIELKPSTYVTKLGDNMRRLGSKLLGFQEGWKEIWAINQNIDSKTELPPGIELRYWTGDEQKVMAKADIDMQEPPPMVESSPTIPVAEENMSPEPPSIADAPVVDRPDIPDVPPQAAMAEEPGLPIADPEPLQEVAVSDDPAAGSAAGTARDAPEVEDASSSFLTIGVMAMIAVAVAFLVAIQIKNRRAQAMGAPPSLEYTQV